MLNREFKAVYRRQMLVQFLADIGRILREFLSNLFADGFFAIQVFDFFHSSEEARQPVEEPVGQGWR